VCGYLTSVAFGHTVGKCVGLGYVRKLAYAQQKDKQKEEEEEEEEEADRLVTPDWIKAGRYEIEVAAKRLPAIASLQPPYDPKNERVRA